MQVSTVQYKNKAIPHQGIVLINGALNLNMEVVLYAFFFCLEKHPQKTTLFHTSSDVKIRHRCLASIKKYPCVGSKKLVWVFV